MPKIDFLLKIGLRPTISVKYGGEMKRYTKPHPVVTLFLGDDNMRLGYK